MNIFLIALLVQLQVASSLASIFLKEIKISRALFGLSLVAAVLSNFLLRGHFRNFDELSRIEFLEMESFLALILIFSVPILRRLSQPGVSSLSFGFSYLMKLMGSIFIFSILFSTFVPNSYSGVIESRTKTKSSQPVELSDIRYNDIKPLAERAFSYYPAPDWTQVPEIFTGATVPKEDFRVVDRSWFPSDIQSDVFVIKGSYFTASSVNFRPHKPATRHVNIGKSKLPVVLVIIDESGADWEIKISQEANVKRILQIKSKDIKSESDLRWGHVMATGDFKVEVLHTTEALLELTIGDPIASNQNFNNTEYFEVPFYTDHQLMVDLVKANARLRDERRIKKLDTNEWVIMNSNLVASGKPLSAPPIWPQEFWNPVIDGERPQPRTHYYVPENEKYYATSYLAKDWFLEMDPHSKKIEKIKFPGLGVRAEILGFNGFRNELVLVQNSKTFGYNLKTGSLSPYELPDRIVEGTPISFKEIRYHSKLHRLFAIDTKGNLFECDGGLNILRSIDLKNYLGKSLKSSVYSLYPIGDKLIIGVFIFNPSLQNQSTGGISGIIDLTTGVFQELDPSLNKYVN